MSKPLTRTLSASCMLAFVFMMQMFGFWSSHGILSLHCAMLLYFVCHLFGHSILLIVGSK